MNGYNTPGVSADKQRKGGKVKKSAYFAKGGRVKGKMTSHRKGAKGC